jgi:hypothetical protein
MLSNYFCSEEEQQDIDIIKRYVELRHKRNLGYWVNLDSESLTTPLADSVIQDLLGFPDVVTAHLYFYSTISIELDDISTEQHHAIEQETCELVIETLEHRHFIKGLFGDIKHLLQDELFRKKNESTSINDLRKLAQLKVLKKELKMTYWRVGQPFRDAPQSYKLAIENEELNNDIESTLYQCFEQVFTGFEITCCQSHIVNDYWYLTISSSKVKHTVISPLSKITLFFGQFISFIQGFEDGDAMDALDFLYEEYLKDFMYFSFDFDLSEYEKHCIYWKKQYL